MPFPTTPILEDFNRADQNPLTTNWTCPLFTGEGSLQIVSNQVKGNTTGSAFNNGWYDIGTYGPDCEAYYTLITRGAAGHLINLFVRLTSMDGSPNGYFVRHILTGAGADTIRIRRIDNGVSSALGADITSVRVELGQKIGIQCIGDQISAYHFDGVSWNLLGTRTDGTYTSQGYIALDIQDTTTVCENLGGGSYNPNFGNLSLPPPHVGRGAGW